MICLWAVKRKGGTARSGAVGIWRQQVSRDGINVTSAFTKFSFLCAYFFHYDTVCFSINLCGDVLFSNEALDTWSIQLSRNHPHKKTFPKWVHCRCLMVWLCGRDSVWKRGYNRPPIPLSCTEKLHPKNVIVFGQHPKDFFWKTSLNILYEPQSETNGLKGFKIKFIFNINNRQRSTFMAQLRRIKPWVQ